MKTKSTMSILFKVAALFFMATITLTNCKKAEDVAPIPAVTGVAVPPDLTTKVTSNMVSGFVTDGNNAAVKDASVLIGTTTVLTDKYGYFEARNVQMVQNAAVVSVSKTGFFKGIKTFIATANKGAFFRIKLMPKTSAGTVSGTAGGNITLASGLGISFPASAIVNAATNAAYTGAVTVAAFYINPTSADLPLIMPGDLRGLNTDGNLQLLTTYGMVAVELTGTGGELLQIATGKKATLTMPIPAALSTTAPVSIPLWYFNEANGLWKQEGTATKTGNVYVGDVSHFSFWNCDVPGNYVQFNCTVVSSTGLPIQYAYVKVSIIGLGYGSGYGYTDSTGYTGGIVPANSQLKIEIFENSFCNNPDYSQNFATTNVNISLGTIVLPSISRIANLTGVVKNCSNANVSNGYIILNNGNNATRYPLSNSGTYSISKLVCNFPSSTILIGEDLNTSLQSPPLNYTINNAGVNLVPNIIACGVTAQQFFNLTDNGTSFSYTVPIDSMGSYLTPPNLTFSVYANRIPNVNSQSCGIEFGVNGPSPVPIGTSEPVSFFSSPLTVAWSNQITGAVVISEYGPIGQFVAGTFSVVKTDVQTSVVHNITGNFRVRRYN
jgi:hypothetical protein